MKATSHSTAAVTACWQACGGSNGGLSRVSTHTTRMRIPPWPAYIDVDYLEQLLEVKGKVMVEGQPLEIQGIGKLDYNSNRW